MYEKKYTLKIRSRRKIQTDRMFCVCGQFLVIPPLVQVLLTMMVMYQTLAILQHSKQAILVSTQQIDLT